MKKISLLIFLLSLLYLPFFIVSTKSYAIPVSSDSSGGSSPASCTPSATINPSSTEITLGSKVQFTSSLTVTGGTATNKSYTWEYVDCGSDTNCPSSGEVEFSTSSTAQLTPPTSGYFNITLAISFSCNTYNYTAYDYVTLEVTEPPEEEDDEEEEEDPENTDEEDDDTDECTESTWYEDSDSDSYGNADSSTQACDQPTGYVSDSSDCNDENPSINPSATEVCNDEVDNNCDGTTDSDIPTWYLDSDADSYGDSTQSTQACDQPTGYVSDSSDCDDTNSAISPAGTETSDDDIDQDCSGADSTTTDSGDYATDECLTNYTDACLTDDDGDGFCESTTECSDGSEPGDCDDTTSDTNPDADEICDDGVDNNCDGLTIVTSSLTKGLSTSNLSTSTSYTCIAANEEAEENGSGAEEDGASGCGCDLTNKQNLWFFRL